MNVLRAGGQTLAGDEGYRDKENAPGRQNGNYYGNGLTKQHAASRGVLGLRDPNVQEHQGKLSRPSISLKDNLATSPRLSMLDPRPDVQMVEQFSQGIFVHLKGIEQDYCPSNDCIKRQKDLNEKMREILLDWMVDVTVKYKLLHATFVLAVNLVDRYLSTTMVTRDKFQLLGATALHMAAKYEEIYPPTIKEFLSICDNAFLKSEMVNLEAKILLSVAFKLAVPSVLNFLERYTRVGDLKNKEYHFTCYLLDISMISGLYLDKRPSLVAASAVYLTNKVFGKASEWSDKLSKETQFGLEAVRPLAKDLFLQLCKPEDGRISALKRKYSTAEHFEVSRYRLEWTRTSGEQHS